MRREPIRARLLRPEHEARNTHAQAVAARREAEELRALEPGEVAALIETKRAAAEHAQQRAEERARRLRSSLDRTGAHAETHREGPHRGL